MSCIYQTSVNCLVDTEANLPTTDPVITGMFAVTADTGSTYRCISLNPVVWQKLITAKLLTEVLSTRALDGEDGEQGDRGFPGKDGAPGTAGATGPAVFLEAESGDEGPMGPPSAVVGPTGAPGLPGPAVFLEADQGEAGDQGFPGVNGLSGSAGTTGGTGPAGPAVFLEADVGDDGPMGPPSSVVGPAGAPGLPGAAVFLEADAGEPGDQGFPGVNGLPGTSGGTGGPGPAGPAVFLEADAGDEGPLGPPGVVPTISDPIGGSYTPGSFTVATGRYASMVKRLQLTTTQRATLAGTARLRID